MTDPIAVSILAKLTSWYDFNGDFTDAHGPNNLTAAVNPGFETGIVGQALKKGARAAATLGAPVNITPTSGRLTIGGWLKFSAAVPNVASFGLTFTPSSPANEVFYLFNQTPDGNFGAFGFPDTGPGTYNVVDPSRPSFAYPITVRVTDTEGSHLESDQVIRIQTESGLVPGFYFVTATYNNGLMSLYVNGEARASASPPSSVHPQVKAIQIANQYGSTVSDAGLDACFFCTNAVLTLEEHQWLYNAGAGRTHADIVALAA